MTRITLFGAAFVVMASGACSDAGDAGANGGSAGTAAAGSGGAAAGTGATGGAPGGTGGTSGAFGGTGGALGGTGGAPGGTGGALGGTGGALGGTGGALGGTGGALGGAGGALGGAGGALGGMGGALGGTGGSGGGDGCPLQGQISYVLNRATNPTADEQTAYDRITEAMDTALSYYNCYTDITKALSVSYVPSVPTADGNVNGSIRFGAMSSMNHITAMHEISHTLGVGSGPYQALIVDGVFTGSNATETLRAITGNPEDQLHGDNQHFWPYGLNYTNEVMSEQDLINHCKLVVAIRLDIEG